MLLLLLQQLKGRGESLVLKAIQLTERLSLRSMVNGLIWRQQQPRDLQARWKMVNFLRATQVKYQDD
jgi:hypothetical protein